MMKNTHSAKRKSTRHFLLLQGPHSSFFKQLAVNLREENCKVTKVNFNTTDQFFYGEGNINYTYPESQWKSYVSDIAKMRGVTDLVVFGDQKQFHATAIEQLRDDGVDIHVFAGGYFNDSHITLEKLGVNSNSALPREPMFYMRTPTIHSEEVIASQKPIAIAKDFNDVCAAILSKNLERNTMPFCGLNFVKKLSLQAALRGKKYIVASLEDNELHLADEIVTSFQEHCKDTTLLIHSTLKGWKSANNVLHVPYANLNSLVKNADGMIVAGSINGMIALENNTPLVALKDTVFNFAGLTNQSKLLGFWYRRTTANPTLYGKFRNHLMAKTQTTGGFYGKKAIAQAARISAKTLLTNADSAVGNNVSENV